MFTIFIVVMVSRLYTYDQTYQIVYFTYLLIIVCFYTSIKLFFKKHLHLLLVSAGPKQVPYRYIRVSFIHLEDFIYWKRVLGWDWKPFSSPSIITSFSHCFLIAVPLFLSVLTHITCFACLSPSSNSPLISQDISKNTVIPFRSGDLQPFPHPTAPFQLLLLIKITQDRNYLSDYFLNSPNDSA